VADLELTIVVQDEQTVKARTDSGREVAGRIELTPWHRDLIRVFQHWLAQDKISKREELEVLGELLYFTLFNKNIRKLYNDLRRDAHPENRLRVQLSFREEAGDLANYPWEFLYAPGTAASPGYFLATVENLVLSKYMLPARVPDPAELPLRLLIVVSKPDDPELGHVKDEPVRSAISEFAKNRPIDIQCEFKPTTARFLNKMVDFKPHILHFIGHGRYDEKEREGSIALVDDQRNVNWVPDGTFADYFKQKGTIPRLIILHSCEGGKNDITAKFAGLAPQLILSGVQAVVAMQYMITNAAAIDFSKYFYEQIARGEPVDYAVQISRWQLAALHAKDFNSRVFGTPILYMSAYDSIVPPEG